MKFSIDQQSLRDLNIFTSTADAMPIIKLFRLTKTLGGREMLHEMMNSPSADINFLENRIATIQYIKDQKLSLAISSDQLDLIEHYLKYDKNFLRNNIIDSSLDFIKNKIHLGVSYYTITTGIKYIIKLTETLRQYIQTIKESDAPKGIKLHAENIEKILELPLVRKTTTIPFSKLRFYHINKIDGLVRKKLQKDLRVLLRLVYELDVYEALAYIMETKGMCLPTYSASETLSVSIKGVYHPEIKNAVVNDIEIDQHNNMTFLTGSNMAGKSSFLKAVGLSVYLAHIGFPIFANQMTTTVFNGMITTINLPDNLTNGLSHYYSEVKRVKETATKLIEDKKIFVIFDELFRGTNVKDAFDASLLIISELTSIRNSAFFISTHIVELAEELTKYQNVSFKYMDTFFREERPVFTYKLVNGISKERIGMYIVKNEGIVEIIREAVKNQQ
ncbi:DNA mismatch repair protein MutS [Pedobacter sp. UYP24]